MDYKEKYEQALERAKKLQANAKGLVLNKWLYGVFPELEETEDERIRKYLIGGIKHLSEKSSFFTDEVSKGKVIAWLEKQKEQKPVNTIVEDLPKGEDYGIDSLWHAIQILERTLGEVEGYQSDDGILEHKCAIEAIKRLYKQKPSGWSKEDENMLSSFLHKVEVCDLLSNKESVWILKKLKSLKPQPHWKPTEEQLENLLNACNRAYLTSGQLQSLMRLYLKLKSL